MVKPESSNRGGHNQRNIGANGSTSRYKGVRMRKWGKWVAEIRLPNSRDRVWLGSYETPEKAARAYDAAVYCVRGPSAEFNFPRATPPDIPVSRNLNHQQIQAVASRYANQVPQEMYAEGNAGVVGDGHGRQQVTDATPSTAVQNPVLVDLPSELNREELVNWPEVDPTFLPESNGYVFSSGFDGFLGDF